MTARMTARRVVVVDAPALDALIEYADRVREQRDQEFLVSVQEHRESAAEINALVDNLKRRGRLSIRSASGRS